MKENGENQENDTEGPSVSREAGWGPMNRRPELRLVHGKGTSAERIRF